MRVEWAGATARTYGGAGVDAAEVEEACEDGAVRVGLVVDAACNVEAEARLLRAVRLLRVLALRFGEEIDELLRPACPRSLRSKLRQKRAEVRTAWAASRSTDSCAPQSAIRAPRHLACPASPSAALASGYSVDGREGRVVVATRR